MHQHMMCAYITMLINDRYMHFCYSLHALSLASAFAGNKPGRQGALRMKHRLRK